MSVYTPISFEAYGEDATFFEAARSRKIQEAEDAKARAERELINGVLTEIAPDIDRIGRETGAKLIQIMEAEQQSAEAMQE
jgi:hypothetical protein